MVGKFKSQLGDAVDFLRNGDLFERKIETDEAFRFAVEPKDANAALAAVSHDKKMDGSKINYVYCPEIGRFEFRSASLDEYAEMVLRGTNGEAF